MADPELKKVS